MKRRALITSMALLLVAIVCLSTATYAWFTSNPIATATGFAVNTSTSGNLLIAEGSSPAAGDFHTTIALSSVTSTFQPVSTVDCANWWTAEAEAPESSPKAASDSYSAASSSNYFTKVVTFKSDDAGTLYLSGISKTKDANDSDLLESSLRVAVKVGNGSPVICSLVERSGAIAVNAAGNGTSACVPEYTYTSSTTAIGNITAGGTITATIYIWIEGEDTRCFTNNASSYTLSDIDLSFTVATS